MYYSLSVHAPVYTHTQREQQSEVIVMLYSVYIYLCCKYTVYIYTVYSIYVYTLYINLSSVYSVYFVERILFTYTLHTQQSARFVEGLCVYHDIVFMVFYSEMYHIAAYFAEYSSGTLCCV